jgi:hypothetical protein
MPFLSQLFFFVALACALLLIVGLFRPWSVLWWEDVQNRRKVINWYGSATLLFYVLSVVLKGL